VSSYQQSSALYATSSSCDVDVVTVKFLRIERPTTGSLPVLILRLKASHRTPPAGLRRWRHGPIHSQFRSLQEAIAKCNRI
jgi:hypothetical protein